MVSGQFPKHDTLVLWVIGLSPILNVKVIFWKVKIGAGDRPSYIPLFKDPFIFIADAMKE